MRNKKFLFHKINRKYAKKTRKEIFCTNTGMISCWIQNFVQGSFSIKSLKLCHKSGGEFLTSGPFYNVNFQTICFLTKEIMKSEQPKLQHKLIFLLLFQ